MALLNSYIIYGNETEFLSADKPIYTDMGLLSESKFVIVYQDNSDSNHGTAKIGVVSGIDVTFGAETEYISANGFTNAVSVVALSESGFVVIYQDESDSGHGTARIGQVSGTTITFGSEFEYLSTARSSYANVSKLDSTHFVVGYADGNDSDHGKVVIGTVNGTNISFGSAATFHSAGSISEGIVLASFGPSGFVVTYKESAAANLHGTARFGSVSGSTITLGSDAEFVSVDNSDPSLLSIDRIGASGFVIVYRDTIGSNHGSTKFGSISGTTITFGAESEFLSADGTQSNRVATLDSSSFVVSYKDGSDSGHGTTKIGVVDGTDISFTEEYEFLSSGGASNLSIISLNSQKIVVAYTDESDSNHGTVKVGLILQSASPSTPSVGGQTLRIINRLTKTADYDPQIISAFPTPPTSVNIEVWDIVDGQNIVVAISNSGCYSIGDTSRWGWSTANLPFTDEKQKYHYYFRMTSDTSEEQYGEFFITVPERGLRSHPDRREKWLG